MISKPKMQNVYAPGVMPGSGGTTGVDKSVTTLTLLAAIPTVNLTVPVVKLWIQESDGTLQAWRLLAGTDATVAGSIQRPDDFNAVTNGRVWYHAES